MSHKDRSSAQLAAMRRAVERFNRKHPVGSVVRFRAGQGDACSVETVRVAQPGGRIDGGRTAVVHLVGRDTPVPLTRIMPAPAPRRGGFLASATGAGAAQAQRG